MQLIFLQGSKCVPYGDLTAARERGAFLNLLPPHPPPPRNSNLISEEEFRVFTSFSCCCLVTSDLYGFHYVRLCSVVDFHVRPKLLQIFKCVSSFTAALVRHPLIQDALSSLPVGDPHFFLGKLVTASEDTNIVGEILS